MRVYNLIRKFCEENDDRYSVYEEDSTESKHENNCLGILVKNDCSYMEMLMKLTEFMENEDLSGEELEFSEGISIEELGLDTIVYFPNIVLDEKSV